MLLCIEWTLSGRVVYLTSDGGTKADDLIYTNWNVAVTTTTISNFPKFTRDRLAARFKETNFNVPKVATALSERRR
jgi:hypothetical protein